MRGKKKARSPVGGGLSVGRLAVRVFAPAEVELVIFIGAEYRFWFSTFQARAGIFIDDFFIVDRLRLPV